MQKDISIDGVTTQTQARFENVAAALYLVTNHLSASEPLKHKIRSLSQIVLEEFVALSDLSTKVIHDRLGHIRSLLKIASVSGMISNQNVALIDTEIGAIQLVIKDLQNTAANLSVSIGKVLMLDFVGGPLAEKGYLPNVNVNHVDRAPSISPATPIVTTSPVHIPQNHVPAIEKPVYQPTNSRAPIQQQRTVTQTVSGFEKKVVKQSEGGTVSYSQPTKAKEISTGMSERQNNIIREIKNKGQLTIRDLVGKIQGCSEKTIQRELLALVDGGVLKKEGERRWSKYSVN